MKYSGSYKCPGPTPGTGCGRPISVNKKFCFKCAVVAARAAEVLPPEEKARVVIGQTAERKESLGRPKVSMSSTEAAMLLAMGGALGFGAGIGRRRLRPPEPEPVQEDEKGESK